MDINTAVFKMDNQQGPRREGSLGSVCVCTHLVVSDSL